MENLKRTPLFDEHVRLGAKMVPFGGWEMPVWYTSLKDEHHTVRNNVGIFDVSHMGEPKAEEMLQEISGVDLKEIPYYNFTEGRINGIPCLISRTGYTGEDGFEIYFDREAAVPMWRKLMELLPKYDGKPAGLGARDTLRLEATYLLYGNDMTDDITPLEAGLKWAVDMEKDFIGKEILLKEKETGIRRRLKGIEMLERGIPRHGYKIFVGDEEVGFITSGTVSPTLDKPVALAMLNKPYYKKDTEIEVEIRGKRVKAKVIKTPFYRGSVKTRK
ncbi:MAG: hypothetical protein B6I29_05090 [Marinitoga sp. 4572_148]|nr:MAG: hypothetical protein B6I29_05090 [Marinitoga sp. 4572_148]